MVDVKDQNGTASVGSLGGQPKWLLASESKQEVFLDSVVMMSLIQCHL